MEGMSNEIPSESLDRIASQELIARAVTAFQPRSPISTRELFAGRWEQLTTVCDSVAQTGLHIVIFGERGVGKTSLANVIEPVLYVMEESLGDGPPSPRLVVKINTHQGDSFVTVWRRALDEVYWVENKPMMGFDSAMISERVSLREALGVSDEPSIDEVRRVLSTLRRSVFIFDEFDRGASSVKRAFTDLVKTLSDYAVDTTVVIVGVSDTVDDLVRDHASIVRSIVQVQLPRMNERELKEILEKGSKALNVAFSEDAASLVVRMSQGLPHYTHLIGLHATREAAKRLSRVIESTDVHASFTKAVQQAFQSIQEKYLSSIHSAHKDALYRHVILACASAASTAKDALGYFYPADVVKPLCEVLQRNNVTIATFQKHLNEFRQADRGPILERAGNPRSYRYRFRDPLLPPFIFMTAVSDGLVDPVRLKKLTEVH